MGQKQFVILQQRGVLKVSGEDRVTFLQGLISNDVRKISPERAIHAALLTAQGKFLHEFFIAGQDEHFLLDGERERLEDLKRRLSLYKLRSKVTLEILPDWVVLAVPEPEADAFGLSESRPAQAFAGGIAFFDPRVAGAGLRLLLPAADLPRLVEAGYQEAPFALWDHHRLALGLADGSRDLAVEKAILLENGFDEWGSVDFKKGCYMGQELTARTKYRGLIRRRLLPVTIEGAAPPSGTPLLLAGEEIGEMRSSSGDKGLAVLRLERLEQLSASGLVIEGAILHPETPSWAILPKVAS